MKRLFWTGVGAIVALTVAFGFLVWWFSDGGQRPMAVAPAQPEVVPAMPLPSPEAPGVQPVEPESAAVDVVSDRDPRNDVQRPSDRRGDLLQQERGAKLESAMDALNRRTALRKEMMEANGEVRPSVPTQKVKR